MINRVYTFLTVITTAINFDVKADLMEGTVFSEEIEVKRHLVHSESFGYDLEVNLLLSIYID